MNIMIKAITLLSALLLFTWELLVSQELLPIYGGSHQVWLVSVCFYTFTLFLGYMTAPFVFRFFQGWKFLHIFLLLVTTASLFFPMQGTGQNMLGLFKDLGVMAFLPIFMLSMTTPLLQIMLDHSEKLGEGKLHYNFYAYSNLGSVVALLLVPIFLLPLLDSNWIHTSWIILFIVYCGLLSFYLVKYHYDAEVPAIRHVWKLIPSKSIWLWIALSFLGSLLYLSVTNFIALSLGSLPFTWAIPLLIYLVTFILAFDEINVPEWLLKSLALLWIISFAFDLVFFKSLVIEAINFYLLLFVSSLAINKKLYSSRPQDKEQVGPFYICMNLGGVLGTVFISVLIPVIPWQYQVSLIEVDLSFLGLITFFLLSNAKKLPGLKNTIRLRSAKMIFLLLGVIWLFLFDQLTPSKTILHSQRGFYGIHKVFQLKDRRILLNGRTIHGGEYSTEEGKGLPIKYYHLKSPLGQYFNTYESHQDVAMVGLGVGSILYYSNSNENWDIYEIDSQVVDIADNYFSFIKNSKGNKKFHMGDGRMSLAKQSRNYDVIIFDAFGSISIPQHLVTMEAIQEYMSKLKEGGILLFHVSNPTFNLVTTLARTCEKLGLSFAYNETNLEDDLGKTSSRWMAITKDKSKLLPLINNFKWKTRCKGGSEWYDYKMNFWSALKQPCL
jgi:hypothetical protein